MYIPPRRYLLYAQVQLLAVISMWPLLSCSSPCLWTTVAWEATWRLLIFSIAGDICISQGFFVGSDRNPTFTSKKREFIGSHNQTMEAQGGADLSDNRIQISNALRLFSLSLSLSLSSLCCSSLVGAILAYYRRTVSSGRGNVASDNSRIIAFQL